MCRKKGLFASVADVNALFIADGSGTDDARFNAVNCSEIACTSYHALSMAFERSYKTSRA